MSERFEHWLKQTIGLDAGSVGTSSVARAIRQRMAASQVGDSEAYWQAVQSNAEERQALIEAVVVPETWFFRYPESFATLAQLVVQHRARWSPARKLRLLSLPCSTGEEPYSIAMCLLDAGLPAGAFEIDALDISPSLLLRARQAVYGRNAFRGEAQAFRLRYFCDVGNGLYELAEPVRACVRFGQGNVLDPLLLADVARYDFVFCRNLLIYFDLPTQQRVLRVLQRLAHADEGMLFIGPAEASLLSGQGLQSLGRTMSFAFRNTSRPTPAASSPLAVLPLAVPATTMAGGRPLPAVRVEPRLPPVPKALPPLPRTPPKAASPAAPAQAVAAPRREPTVDIAHLARLADSGRTDEAWQCCQQYLQAHGPAADVFYWLGLLCDTRGEASSAQDYYRKALYLQPHHGEALAHLAALLMSRGDIEGARRLRERARREVNHHA